jgi:hypothetical protein
MLIQGALVGYGFIYLGPRALGFGYQLTRFLGAYQRNLEMRHD